MAKTGGDDDFWKLLGIVGAGLTGLALLDYLLGGRRSENNAVFIPDRFEDQIDLVVEELDKQFGKQWVNETLNRIMNSLQRALPLPVVAAVYAAELMSKNSLWTMSGPAKKQVAINKLQPA
jgi:hypothetical protein